MSLAAGRPVTPPTFNSLDDVVAFRSFMQVRDPGIERDYPRVARFEESVLVRDVAGAPVTAEIYVPEGQPPFPVLLYLHGGGWCAGTAEHFRKLAMRFAQANHVVVNLNYRLAPEHPFPCGLEDCVYAARWIVEQIHEYDGDSARLVIAGSSSGANLAAATIVALSSDLVSELDEADLAGREVTFKAALLLYGIFDFCLLNEEEPETWHGMVEFMFNLAYLGPHYLSYHRHPLVSPLRAPNLAAFPQTYLSCGDQDLLVSHSLAMASALTQARVPTTLSVVQGLNHAFAQIPHVLPVAEQELQRICEWLAACSLEPAEAAREVSVPTAP